MLFIATIMKIDQIKILKIVTVIVNVGAYLNSTFSRNSEALPN